MKQEIKIDISEECGSEGFARTEKEEFTLLNEVWGDIKDEVSKKDPPYRVEITSPNFKLTFVEVKKW